MNELASPTRSRSRRAAACAAAAMVRPTTDSGVGTQSSVPAPRAFTLPRRSGVGDAADQRARPLPGLHQRPARRRRPADARLDQLLGPAAATRPTTSATCCRTARTRIDIWLGDGWYRSRMMWPRERRSSTPGATRSRRSPRLRDGSRRRAAGHRRELAERPHADPQVRHLFRRELRRARRELVADHGRRGGLPISTSPRLIPHEINGVRELDAAAGGRRASPMPKAAPSTTSARTPAAMSPSPSRAKRGARVTVEHAEMLDQRRPVRPRQHALGRGADRICAQGRRRRSTTGRPSPSSASATPGSTIEGNAAITSHRVDPDQLGDHADGALQLGATRWSTGWSRTPSGRSAPTSSTCPPTARSATSGSAGPATRRSSPRTACYLHESHGILAQVCARRDRRPARRTAPSRMSSPDPDPQPRGRRPRLLRLDRLGRCHLRHPAGCSTSTTATAASSRKRCRRWSGGTTSSGRSATGRSCTRRRAGATAASPSATGCSRRATAAKPCPTIGDDAAATIYLYISSALIAARRRSRRRRRATARRMRERAEQVKAAFVARVHHRRRAAWSTTTRPPMRWRSSMT